MVRALFAGGTHQRNARKVTLVGQVLDALPEGFPPRVAAGATAQAAAARQFERLVEALEQRTETKDDQENAR